MLLIFTKYLSQPNIVLMLFKILVLVKYTGNTAHDIYRGWIYCWYFSRYFSSLIMLIILFKILFLANILSLSTLRDTFISQMCCQYFSRYFSRANAVWEQVDVRPPGALSLCLLQQELNWKESKASQLQMGGEKTPHYVSGTRLCFNLRHKNILIF